mgnify:CR=1 FL=1
MCGARILPCLHGARIAVEQTTRDSLVNLIIEGFQDSAGCSAIFRIIGPSRTAIGTQVLAPLLDAFERYAGNVLRIWSAKRIGAVLDFQIADLLFQIVDRT